MSDHLLELGAGVGSKVESVKAESDFLRGTIAEQLLNDSPNLSESDANLLKFHGSYQQEDRDQRRARRDEGSGKAYQFMIRTRVPGGVLSAAQYLAEETLADKYGNGTLRITTRQGFQHHGVLKGDLRSAIAEINSADLTTLAACGDVNRNVMTCPAPIRTSADEAIVEIAQAIARHLTPATRGYREIWVDGERVEQATPDVEPIYGPTYLPRKFKIGIARPDDNCVDVYTQDIGLVADVEGERLLGFTILVGGGMGMTHGKTATYPRLGTSLCFAVSDDVLGIVEAIVTTYRDWGDRNNRKHARLKYLVEERGIAWFRTEVQRRSDIPLRAPRPVRLSEVDDHLGWQPQPNGRWCFGLFIENGRIKDDETSELRTALRTVIDRFRPGVHLTAQQNILLTDILVPDIPELTRLFESHRVAIDPRKLGAHRHAMACPALPTCGLALTDAERVLPDVVAAIDAELEQLGFEDRPLSIRMTGCPNGCARPYMGDIGFVGRSKDLYDIFLGGDWANTRLNWLFATGIRLNELASTVAPLLRRWQQEGEDEESFGDFCHRLGREALTAVAAAS
ncbi:MAG TPA: NADPH-dependent assimilatory sulfite reductase hemoprotein subunit [Candidatus Baltobacteraceae bacterium]|jgi:sulfite reductase (ferredoxin)